MYTLQTLVRRCYRNGNTNALQCYKYISFHSHQYVNYHTNETKTSATSTSSSPAQHGAVDSLRNFGIIAHIDAGKTTCSERMLYYAGRTRSMGEVHDGNTVLDFLAEERARGITIQSACVQLPWKQHSLQLVDSPGHVDFSVEVERCVRVLDGAVVVVDGVSGVQAQTQTVWQQAKRYGLPALMFINKLDRAGASFNDAVNSIRQRLNIHTLITQLPLFDGDNLVGIIDLINRSEVRFEGERGVNVCVKHDTFKNESEREQLIEQLAEHNDDIMESFVNGIDVSSSTMQSAVRKAVLDGKASPILCGSALHNIGIQTLLDSVVAFLPSPADTLSSTTTSSIAPPACDSSASLCAFVFKVVVDRNRGALAFVRVYTGILRVRDVVWCVNNINQPQRTRIHKLLRIDGASFRETKEVYAGHICAIVGIKDVRTGDTLGISATTQLQGILTPDPVFSCSVEPETSAQQDALDEALDIMQQEDPSLRVSEDNVTGQTLLSGLGELHLDIVRQRLLSQFNITVELGRMIVSMRETLTACVSHTSTIHNMSSNEVTITIRCEPLEKDAVNIIELDESIALSRDVEISVRKACVSALSRGPLLALSMLQVSVKVMSITHSGGAQLTPENATQAILQAIAETARLGKPILLEPYVQLEVRCGAEHVGDILGDLNARRRAEIINVDVLSAKISAFVPVGELLGYANSLRSLTHGAAHYATSKAGYRPAPSHIQQRELGNASGGHIQEL